MRKPTKRELAQQARDEANQKHFQERIDNFLLNALMLAVDLKNNSLEYYVIGVEIETVHDTANHSFKVSIHPRDGSVDADEYVFSSNMTYIDYMDQVDTLSGLCEAYESRRARELALQRQTEAALNKLNGALSKEEQALLGIKLS